MLKRVAGTIALLSLMTACAGISTGSMTRIEDGAVILVEQDVVYEKTQGLVNMRYKVVMKRGAYRAVLSDQGGTYYQGSPACFQLTLLEGGRSDYLGKKIGVLDCGFYVPNDSRHPLAVYRVLGTGASVEGFNSLEEIERLSQKQAVAGLTDLDSEAIRNREARTDVLAVGQAASMQGQRNAYGIAGATYAVLGSIETGRIDKANLQPDPAFLAPLLRLPVKR